MKHNGLRAFFLSVFLDLSQAMPHCLEAHAAVGQDLEDRSLIRMLQELRDSCTNYLCVATCEDQESSRAAVAGILEVFQREVADPAIKRGLEEWNGLFPDGPCLITVADLDNGLEVRFLPQPHVLDIR